ncbi:hypothetical protein [Photorhabdus asymbiotica]
MSESSQQSSNLKDEGYKVKEMFPVLSGINRMKMTLLICFPFVPVSAG